MIYLHYDKENGKVKSFYDSTIHKEIPLPNIKISKEQHKLIYQNMDRVRVDLDTLSFTVIPESDSEKKLKRLSEIRQLFKQANKNLNKYKYIKDVYYSLTTNDKIIDTESNITGKDKTYLKEFYTNNFNNIIFQETIIRSYKKVAINIINDNPIEKVEELLIPVIQSFKRDIDEYTINS